MNKDEIIAQLEGIEGLDKLTVPNLELILALKTGSDKVAGLEEAATKQTDLIKKLNKALDKKDAAVKSGKKEEYTFTEDGKKFLLVVERSTYKDQLVTAETLEATPELRATLVKIQSGAIRQIED